MPAILVIGSTAQGDDMPSMLLFQDEFLAYAQEHDIDISIDLCHYDEIRLEYKDGSMTAIDCHNARPVESYDLVMLKGAMKSMYLPYILSHYLADKGIPCINDYRAYRRLNKLVQLFHATKLSIPIPRTSYVESRKLLAEIIAKDWEFPAVLKSNTGSKGCDNYLVKHASELNELLAVNPEVQFMVQQYIPNDGDYRVLLFGDEPVVLHRRARGGSYLNNTSQGAMAKRVPASTLPEEVIHQARTIARHQSMAIVGVDVIQHKETGKFYLLETNTQPRIKGKASYEALASLLEKTFTNNA